MSAERPAHTEGLEVNEVADGLVVYHPVRDRVHYFNSSSSLIFELCNGERDVRGIAEQVAEAFELPRTPLGETQQCVDTMFAEDLLC